MQDHSYSQDTKVVVPLEELSQEDLIQKCKHLVVILKKTKGSRDDAVKECEKTKLEHAKVVHKLEMQINKDDKETETMQEMLTNFTENKMLLATKNESLQRQLTVQMGEVNSLKEIEKTLLEDAEVRKIEVGNLKRAVEVMSRDREKLRDLKEQNECLESQVNQMEKLKLKYKSMLIEQQGKNNESIAWETERNAMQIVQDEMKQCVQSLQEKSESEVKEKLSKQNLEEDELSLLKEELQLERSRMQVLLEEQKQKLFEEDDKALTSEKIVQIDCAICRDRTEKEASNNSMEKEENLQKIEQDLLHCEENYNSLKSNTTKLLGVVAHLFSLPETPDSDILNQTLFTYENLEPLICKFTESQLDELCKRCVANISNYSSEIDILSKFYSGELNITADVDSLPKNLFCSVFNLVSDFEKVFSLLNGLFNFDLLPRLCLDLISLEKQTNKFGEAVVERLMTTKELNELKCLKDGILEKEAELDKLKRHFDDLVLEKQEESKLLNRLNETNEEKEVELRYLKDTNEEKKTEFQKLKLQIDNLENERKSELEEMKQLREENGQQEAKFKELKLRFDGLLEEKEVELNELKQLRVTNKEYEVELEEMKRVSKDNERLEVIKVLNDKNKEQATEFNELKRRFDDILEEKEVELIELKQLRENRKEYEVELEGMKQLNEVNKTQGVEFDELKKRLDNGLEEKQRELNELKQLRETNKAYELELEKLRLLSKENEVELVEMKQFSEANKAQEEELNELKKRFYCLLEEKKVELNELKQLTETNKDYEVELEELKKLNKENAVEFEGMKHLSDKNKEQGAEYNELKRRFNILLEEKEVESNELKQLRETNYDYEVELEELKKLSKENEVKFEGMKHLSDGIKEQQAEYNEMKQQFDTLLEEKEVESDELKLLNNDSVAELEEMKRLNKVNKAQEVEFDELKLQLHGLLKEKEVDLNELMQLKETNKKYEVELEEMKKLSKQSEVFLEKMKLVNEEKKSQVELDDLKQKLDDVLREKKIIMDELDLLMEANKVKETEINEFNQLKETELNHLREKYKVIENKLDDMKNRFDDVTQDAQDARYLNASLQEQVDSLLKVLANMKEQKQMQEEKISLIEKELLELCIEKNGFLKKIDLLKSNLECYTVEKDKLNSEIEVIQNELIQLESRNEALVEQTNEMKKQLELSTEKCETLVMENQELKSQLEESKKHEVKLEKTSGNDTNKDQLPLTITTTTVNVSNEHFHSPTATTIATSDTTNTSNEHSQTPTATDEDSFEDKYMKLKSLAIRLKRKLAEQSAELQRLQHLQTEENEKGRDTKKGVSLEASKNIQALQAEIDRLEDAAEASRKKRILDEEERAKCEAVKNEVEEQLAVERERTKQMEVQIMSLEIEVNESKDAMVVLKAQLEETTLKLNLEVERSELLKKALKENEAQSEGGIEDKVRIEQLIKEVKQESMTRCALGLELETLERSSDELREQLLDAEGELKTLRQQVAEGKDERDRLKEETTMLGEGLDTERRRAEDLKQSLSTHKSQLSESRRRQELAEEKKDKADEEIQALNKQLEAENSRAAELDERLVRVETRMSSEADLALTKIVNLERKLTATRSEADSLKQQFDAYKVRAQTVLRDRVHSGGRSDQEESGIEVEQLRAELEAAQVKTLKLESDYTSSRAELGRLRCTIERIQTQLTREQKQRSVSEESLAEVKALLQKSIEAHQAAVASEVKKKEELEKRLRSEISSLEEHHRSECSRWEAKLGTLEGELQRARNSGTNAVESHEIRRLPVVHHQRTLSADETNKKIYAKHDLTRYDTTQHDTIHHFTDLATMVRGRAEGSESSELRARRSPLRAYDPPPLDRLLSEPFPNVVKLMPSQEEDAGRDGDHGILDKKLSWCEERLEQVTWLLRESESENNRLGALCSALKEEVRREGRSTARQAHLQANDEYCKNVFLKFIELKSGDEKARLVPVLRTILQLSQEETQKLAVAAHATVDTNQTGASGGWGNYLHMWSGR